MLSDLCLAQQNWWFKFWLCFCPLLLICVYWYKPLISYITSRLICKFRILNSWFFHSWVVICNDTIAKSIFDFGFKLADPFFHWISILSRDSIDLRKLILVFVGNWIWVVKQEKSKLKVMKIESVLWIFFWMVLSSAKKLTKVNYGLRLLCTEIRRWYVWRLKFLDAV